MKDSYSSVPWAQIRAMRNFFAHDYGSAEPEFVWETLRQDVPALRRVLLEVIAEK
ncbi:MAG: DUF86 domain-containing protein [Thermoguttaceae bacterium]|nr:DUF86 domain-containing protein [Thermoguttaceae bacterium]